MAQNFNIPTNIDHDFGRTPVMDPDRSSFDRSHTWNATFDPDYIYPTLVEEILPGDTINYKPTAFVRFTSALIRPFLSNIYINQYTFFCPDRIIWTSFFKSQGYQANPGDSTSFNRPVFTAFNPTESTLADYMGIPPLSGGATVAPCSLPFRAYQFIINEHFKSQDLQNNYTVDTGDGPDTYSNYALRKACKLPDYFTSCLPNLQKGTAQSIPLGSTAPIIKNPTGAPYGGATIRAEDDGALMLSASLETDGSGYFYRSATSDRLILDPNGTLVADLASASAGTLHTFRQALQVQAIYELDQRAGTRYAEVVQARWGVKFDDILYRPEYLGGSRQRMDISMVPQTSATSGQPTGLGNLGAYGQGVDAGNRIVKSFNEHGWLISLICVRGEVAYQQGLHKKFSRSTRFDLYEPLLANLSEQAVLTKEIYLQGSANPTDDASTFGYQERWAEYKYAMNTIHGRLRSTYATPLDMWHLAEKFTSKPTLSSTFIQSNTPWTRVAAVTSENCFVGAVYHDLIHVRKMPVYSIPGLLPRF